MGESFSLEGLKSLKLLIGFTNRELPDTCLYNSLRVYQMAVAHTWFSIYSNLPNVSTYFATFVSISWRRYCMR